MPLTRTIAVVAAVLAGAGALAGCTGGEDVEPREPAPVALKVAVADTTIGLLVTSTSDAGEGADYTGPSVGAELAAYRLRLGKTPVDLTVVDDQGDADEALAAVQGMIDQGVSGIVVGTTGAHLRPALQAAATAGVPVVAPYLRPTDALPDGVWLTGPDEDAIADGLLAAMEDDRVDEPTVLSADDLPVPEVGAVDQVTVTGSTIDDVVDDLADAVEDGDTDSVVVSGSAPSQGAVVAALQGALPDLPVYQTPEALSPVFADALDEAGGTTAGRFVSVGPPADDLSTLGSDAASDSAAAYFAALRLAADDATFMSALDGSEFADVAAEADLPSHDAVLALVRAAARAKSSEPAAVAKALDGLKLGVKDALAGPRLDFSGASALAAADVVPLNATTQAPGVRPAGLSPALTWFPLPDDGE